MFTTTAGSISAPDTSAPLEAQPLSTTGAGASLPVMDAPRPESGGEVPLPLDDLVQVFKLLSDATRLKILVDLLHRPELHVRALCDRLGQSQPAVSHHLALLRVAGLLECRREGKHNYYRLARQRWQGLVAAVFRQVEPEERRLSMEQLVLSCLPSSERTSSR